MTIPASAIPTTVRPAAASWTFHLRLLGMALLWGLSWPAGRHLAQTMPPLAASAWRFSIAVALLLAWLAWRHRGRLPRLGRREALAVAAGGVVGVFGYAVFFMYGLQLVGASRAALVVTTNPVFTTVLAAWLFREPFNWRIGASLLLALAGAAIVLTHGAPWQLLTGGIGAGEWLLLGCVASWVAYSLIGRAAMRSVEPLAATAYASAVGLALLWAATLALEGRPQPQAYAMVTWWVLALMAVGSTVLAYVWYNEGIAALGAGTASSYISLVPVFGVASSVVLLGETLDASLWFGGALCIAGVVAVQWARR